MWSHDAHQRWKTHMDRCYLITNHICKCKCSWSIRRGLNIIDKSDKFHLTGLNFSFFPQYDKYRNMMVLWIYFQYRASLFSRQCLVIFFNLYFMHLQNLYLSKIDWKYILKMVATWMKMFELICDMKQFNNEYTSSHNYLKSYPN